MRADVCGLFSDDALWRRASLLRSDRLGSRLRELYPINDGLNGQAAFSDCASWSGSCGGQQAQDAVCLPVLLTFIARRAEKPLRRVQRTYFIGWRWQRRRNQKRSQKQRENAASQKGAKYGQGRGQSNSRSLVQVSIP